MKQILLTLIAIMVVATATGNNKNYTLSSPDNKVNLRVEVGEKITWSVDHQSTKVITPSQISMTLSNEVLGSKNRVVKAKTSTENRLFTSHLYKKTEIVDNYNGLTLAFSGDWVLEFRAYNDGVAYRFVINKKGENKVMSEKAEFCFASDYTAYYPYVTDLRSDDDLMVMAHEALYEVTPISKFNSDSLAMSPTLIALADGKKAVITDAANNSYAGMFLRVENDNRTAFRGVFGQYPLETRVGGFNSLNLMPTKRADYIARISGKTILPWRVVVISTDDKELLDNDMVYKLSAPSKIEDVSWVKPGKVAWDWWNNWNIRGVDFKAGINTQTYKYYIDFAASQGIEYIILDEGWSVNTYDILNIVPQIDLQTIIDYGRNKNVGVILWSGWRGMKDHLVEAMEKYSAMGAKGWKIDFIDRDDQEAVESCVEIALMAAKYKMLIDYHGAFKPAGFMAMYPNVVNFEGVKGLENSKWGQYDAPLYDVTMPYIRMLAGAVDYTPGAMTNATKDYYRPNNNKPMSMGTRCHQLAMYTIFEAPLQMLADSPSAYMAEPECTKYIASVPTVFDQTVALSGSVGEWVSIARRNGVNWYVGAMTSWQEREIEVDFSFLGDGEYSAEIFTDGINSDRDATDYKRQEVKVTKAMKMKFKLNSGGGLAMKLSK